MKHKQNKGKGVAGQINERKVLLAANGGQTENGLRIKKAGNGNIVIAKGAEVTVITPDMKKMMGDLLVVVSHNGHTAIINGGQNLDMGDLALMPTTEFDLQWPVGVQCIHNPKYDPDGKIQTSGR